jgi:hypothetical protein
MILTKENIESLYQLTRDNPDTDYYTVKAKHEPIAKYEVDINGAFCIVKVNLKNVVVSEKIDHNAIKHFTVWYERLAQAPTPKQVSEWWEMYLPLSPQSTAGHTGKCY